MSHPMTNCIASPLPARPVSDPSPATSSFRGGRTSAVFALLLTAIAVILGGAAVAGEYHSNPWLLSWIPATCCVTNDCCWEVSERELNALPDDQWEVKSTGQVRRRTAWSPDGKFYRCACDYDNVDKHWVKHQGANTRCLFVPMRSVQATFKASRPVH